ncbi:MAG TPA: CorA family divalent cation transporter [Micromonosporaceae bacterium]|jgi:magnesium transporter
MDIRWITKAGAEPLSGDAVSEVASRDDGVLWVHVDHTDPDGMTLLSNLIPVRPPDVRACHTRSPVPALRAYGDHFFSAMNGLARGTDGRLHFIPVMMFIRPPVVVTVAGPRHEALTDAAGRRDLDAVRERLDAAELRPRSVFELGGAIRIEMLESQEDLVASAARRVAALELSVMQRDPVHAEALLEDLFGLRHDLQTIHTNAAHTHELYAHLSDQVDADPGVLALDPKVLIGLRQTYGHLRNKTDLERDYLQEVLDMFQTRVSTELNRFVRKITAFGTIGIAWTVIAGIYGMNFVHMPELNWRFGYLAALTLMAGVGAVLGVLFRRRGWL